MDFLDNPSPGAWRASLRWLLLMLLVGLLAGCATLEPPRPYTTEAEALSARGAPTRRWSNDDGTSTLEYSTQPNGRSCLMVQVDQGGIVLRQWNALAPENLARVERGMDKEQRKAFLADWRQKTPQQRAEWLQANPAPERRELRQ